MYLKIIVALVGAVFASVGPFSDANADTYPARPIRIVSPAPPGGMSDIYSRLIAARFARLWSQPAVVENKSGTGGYLGADFVARSSPDGYTLLMGTVIQHCDRFCSSGASCGSRGSGGRPPISPYQNYSRIDLVRARKFRFIFGGSRWPRDSGAFGG